MKSREKIWCERREGGKEGGMTAEGGREGGREGASGVEREKEWREGRREGV